MWFYKVFYWFASFVPLVWSFIENNYLRMVIRFLWTRSLLLTRNRIFGGDASVRTLKTTIQDIEPSKSVDDKPIDNSDQQNPTIDAKKSEIRTDDSDFLHGRPFYDQEQVDKLSNSVKRTNAEQHSPDHKVSINPGHREKSRNVWVDVQTTVERDVETQIAMGQYNRDDLNREINNRDHGSKREHRKRD